MYTIRKSTIKEGLELKRYDDNIIINIRETKK